MLFRILHVLATVLQPKVEVRSESSGDSAASLRKKCPYSKLFWSVFSRIWTEYGEILCISPYSVQMRENADQNNSEYGLGIQTYSGPYSVQMWKNLDQNNSESVHFSPSVCFCWCIKNSLIYFAVLLHSF